MITPALFRSYDKPQVMRCKNWFGKKWQKTTKFVKNHKKAVIIAAVVVVAATVIIIATSGAATPLIASGAATAGAGAAGGSKSSSDDDKEKTRTPVNKPGEVAFGEDSNPSPPPPPHSSYIVQQSEEIKNELSEIVPNDAFNVVENEQPSFWNEAKNKARDTGSYIAHELYDAVTDQLSIVSAVSGAFTEKLPEVIKDKTPFEKDCRESYQEMVEVDHGRIDEMFGTDQGNLYSAESKEVRDKLTTGMLPPPGTIKGTQHNSTKGWKVGQPKENLTAKGNVPKWDTVRTRHWKNEALKHRQGSPKKNLNYELTEENLARMEKGLAPQKYNNDLKKWESIELHHDPARKDGGLFDFIEVTPQEHADMDPSRYLGGS